MTTLSISKTHLLDCYSLIKPFIHKTPIFTSQSLNDISGAQLFFKCENFQKTGSFKLRGAMNAILNLSEKQRANGVVAHSSGNFAQAVSYAAKTLGINAYIVMPSTATEIKKTAVRGYGGLITECEPTLQAREATTSKIAKETGATPLHPSNDLDVITGQGTAAIELLETHPNLDIIVTPVGGGGLIAGTALAAHYFGKNCTVIGAEPVEADDAYRSLISGKIEANITTNTIADGLRSQLGNKNFPIIQTHVSKITRVTEDEIITAMRLIWERMKLIVEPSSAVALAGVLRDKNLVKNKKIGIIISGGNIDLEKLPF
jgi:threonine dehydratase